jgi:hypothetical protein
MEATQVQQPIPSLYSWLALATMFQYYGWLDQVVDFCQHFSRNSRVYFRSYHRQTLLLNIKLSRFHPRSFVGCPDSLVCAQLVNTDTGKLSKRSKAAVYILKGAIVQAWNATKKTSLRAVSKKVAQFYKDDVLYYPEDYQICVLIADQFKFYGGLDRNVEQYCAAYYEFCVNDRFLVVVTLTNLDFHQDRHTADLIT